MPTKVILTVVHGSLAGEQFIFGERTTCIIGRKKDCGIQLPDDEGSKKVSRHHCLLDINPPDIRVRDFGSLNGTYVNGVKIGQRESHQAPEEVATARFPEYDLKQGDEIKLGDTMLRVSILTPTQCDECFTEIPEEGRKQAQITSETYRCDSCRRKQRKTISSEILKTTIQLCPGCGRDVTGDVGEYRRGELLCTSCRDAPTCIVNDLVKAASAGDKGLIAIRGYELIKELGRGGMGAVYLVRHNQTGKLVALKIMIPQVATDEYSKDCFLREAENTRALRHPNVVQLQDWGFSNGIFFFTLEYCDRGSVLDLMKRRGGKLSIKEASEIILQALDGLEYAHGAAVPYVKLASGGFGTGTGLVHRDLKPANLLVSDLGNSFVVKVGDYGLAKAFDMAGLSGQTLTGTHAGSPGFMPRQQILNFKYVKPEVDVWAIAASFYNLLTGQLPRDFPRTQDPWQVVLQSAPVPVRDRDSSIPHGLAEVIDLALIDNPQIYFKSAAAFKRALQSAL